MQQKFDKYINNIQVVGDQDVTGAKKYMPPSPHQQNI